jgi:ATP-dependent Clp protease ATP-binding subunit ClpA
VFERFTESARTIVIATQDEARRLEHGQISTPHLLLGLLTSDIGPVLVEHGITAEAVDRELTALLSQGTGDTPSGQAPGRTLHDLDDAEMLASLGIDVAKIREAVEASFGPGALERVPDGEPRPRTLLARLVGRLPGPRGGAEPQDEVSRLRRSNPRRSVRLPFSPAAKKSLELSLREALRLHDRTIDADHLALGLLRTSDGAAAAILSRLDVDIPALRRSLEAHRETARRRSA